MTSLTQLQELRLLGEYNDFQTTGPGPTALLRALAHLPSLHTLVMECTVVAAYLPLHSLTHPLRLHKLAKGIEEPSIEVLAAAELNLCERNKAGLEVEDMWLSMATRLGRDVKAVRIKERGLSIDCPSSANQQALDVLFPNAECLADEALASSHTAFATSHSILAPRSGEKSKRKGSTTGSDWDNMDIEEMESLSNNTAYTQARVLSKAIGFKSEAVVSTAMSIICQSVKIDSLTHPLRLHKLAKGIEEPSIEVLAAAELNLCERNKAGLEVEDMWLSMATRLGRDVKAVRIKERGLSIDCPSSANQQALDVLFPNAEVSFVPVW
ncbi:hypothetical protein QJQ45_003749 [Haematococcus lacustris]|nr:hypothetical protein QJQ45_003749 [Haematococcus lacustris]